MMHKRWGRFTGLAVAACASLLTIQAALARQGVVKTSNGQTYEGDIDDHDPVSVTVTAKGIQTKLDRSHVASVTYSDTATSLADQLAKTNPKDVPANLAIAKQALAAQQLNVARDAAERVLAADPNNAEAASLQNTIQSQLRLEHTKANPPAEPHVAPVTTPTSKATDTKTLRASEINAIRQAEMRADDTGVRIRFERTVLHRFVDYIGKDKAGDFYALNQMQQAQAILQKGPPEMRSDINILNDPPALLTYRRSVQPFLVQSCATSACHGGAMPASAKWSMIVPAESDAATYTNFYNLTKYQQDVKQSAGSVFGSTNIKLIDRQRPSESLLLQYALPGALVQIHHPEAQNYRPPLRGMNDPRYRQLVDWIGQSLQSVDPDYSFDKPATQPATEPTTHAGPATRPSRPAPQPNRTTAAPPRT